MPKDKISIIINPMAGYRKGREYIDLIKEELSHLYHLDFLTTEQPGHAKILAGRAIKNGAKGVVAVGGDGTIYEVINGMNDSPVFLGIIPAGTANVFSLQMRLPLSPKKACRVIANKKIRKIDLGRAGNKRFVLMSGVGFDAQVIQDLNPEVKKMLKDIAYKITGIKTLFTYKPARLKLVIDSKIKTEGYFVVIGNARNYAGHYTITSKAEIDDGLLDVCLFLKGKTRDFIKYITGVMTDTHLFFQDVKYYQAKEILISSDAKVFVQADGESIGELPMKFQILPSALKIITP